MPIVLGGLLAGIIIGPFALGGCLKSKKGICANSHAANQSNPSLCEEGGWEYDYVIYYDL